jgi:hypothetical protein
MVGYFTKTISHHRRVEAGTRDDKRAIFRGAYLLRDPS